MPVAVRVMDCNGQGYTSDVIAGLDWVLANRPTYGAAVYMGFGALTNTSNSALDLAVSNVVGGGTYGIPVVTAAGSYNDGEQSALSHLRRSTRRPGSPTLSIEKYTAFITAAQCATLQPATAHTCHKHSSVYFQIHREYLEKT